MKSNKFSTITAAVLAMAIMTLWVAPAAAGGGKHPLIVPPNSHAYGKSLTEWLTVYWEWNYSGGDLAQSKVGDVQLMPIPAGVQTGGSWTPEDPAISVGVLDITVPDGTPIVLPAFAASGERYLIGPDDQPFDDVFLLESAHPTLTIDGVTVLTDANKAAYYIPATYFDAPVFYPPPTGNNVAAVYFQGVGVVVKPLPVGQHTIKLYEPWILPGYWGVIYDNTWNVTVTRKKHGKH